MRTESWLTMPIKMLMLIGLMCINFAAEAALFDVCIGIEKPKIGTIYENGFMPLTILQVLHRCGGVLVHQKDRDLHRSTQIVFIKMAINGETDDTPLSRGLFECTGTFVYESVGGNAKTIPAFRALSSDEVNAYRKKAAERESADQKIREQRQMELAQQALKEQPEREKYAQELLSALELDIAKHFRLEPALSGKIRISIKHFSWRMMEKQKAEKKWLELLNSMCDVLDQKDDFTHRYTQYPSNEVIKKIVTNFSEKCPLSVSIEIIGGNESQSIYDGRYAVYEKNPLWTAEAEARIRELEKKGGKYPFIGYPVLGRGLRVGFGKRYYVVRNPKYNWIDGRETRDYKGKAKDISFSYLTGDDIIQIMHLFSMREFLMSGKSESVTERLFFKYSDLYERYDKSAISAGDYLDQVCKIVRTAKWEAEFDKLFVEASCSRAVNDLREIERFAVLYGKLRPSGKSKSELSRKLSVLIQAMRNPEMAAIYQKYTKVNAERMFMAFQTEWKSSPKTAHESVYQKYQNAYIGKLQKIASNAGCSKLDEYVSTEDSISPECTDSSVEGVDGSEMVCVKCQGKKKINQQSECEKCGGSGIVIIPGKRLISGYSKPRKGKCPECKGKGRISVWVKCPECQD